MDYAVLAPFGAAVIRSLAGWWENNLHDGYQKADLKKLGETMLKYVPAVIGLVFGLNLGLTEASGIVLAGDISKSWVKEIVRVVLSKKK